MSGKACRITPFVSSTVGEWPTSDFRGFSGTVIAGEIQRGDEITALPSGQTAKIENIVLFEDKFEKALTDQAVTLTLDREIDLSRRSNFVC